MKDQLRDHAPGLERAFDFLPSEDAYEIAPQGRVPAYLRGRYFLNGPARFCRGELRYRNWLDGDGMVSTLRFDDGRVRFTSRWVASEKRRAEEEAGTPLFRAFGTAFPGDRLLRGMALASPVNVSVYPFADVLLAFGEQGLPWALDPDTLETRGAYDFDGRLNEISPFSAHPHIDAESGEMWNFGVSFSRSRPTLNLYRFAADGALKWRRRLRLPAPCSIHDFALSERYAIVYVNPHLLDMASMLDGAAPLAALSWQPALGSRLLIAARRDGERVAEIEVGTGYCLHHVNAFEDGPLLMVDVIELEEPVYDQYTVPEMFRDVRRAEPVRYVVDVAGGLVIGRESLPYRELCDFPAHDPRLAGRPYRRFWVLGIAASERPGRKFFDRLVGLDWSRREVAAVYRAPEGCYLGGEPVFLPDPDDPDGERGALVVQQLDVERMTGAFLIFDAADVGAGPVATLPLCDPIALGFHACWAPEGA